MDITPTQTADLRKLIEETPELADLKQDYPAIAAVLNARPLVSNPAERAVVPKTFSINDVFHAITPTEALDLYKIPGFRQDVERALIQNDRVGIENYMAIASPLLSQESLGALMVLMSQTEDDPNWQPTIAGDSIAMARGWGRLTEHDVQAALT